jgi:hypothetical protein
MDATITYDEVSTLVGINIQLLELHPDFKHIQNLCRHIERALQRLPCPQSLQHGWKGMVMDRELYALHTMMPFHRPNNPSKALTYIRAVAAGKAINNAPLMQMEQATINRRFN